MDAALAALALEHGAILHTTDRDFSRFPRLRWVGQPAGHHRLIPTPSGELRVLLPGPTGCRDAHLTAPG